MGNDTKHNALAKNSTNKNTSREEIHHQNKRTKAKKQQITPYIPNTQDTAPPTNLATKQNYTRPKTTRGNQNQNKKQTTDNTHKDPGGNSENHKR